MASHEIATGAEIRAIHQRALQLLAAIDKEEEAAEEEDDLGREQQQEQQKELGRRTGYAIEALRFCAMAAGALGNPSLADVVIDALRRVQDFDDYAEPHPEVAGNALSALLRAGLKVDKQIRRLAKSQYAHLREAVARGLRPDGDAERELLQGLLVDPVPAVRKAAKASLESVAEVPWWTGKWKSDPAARLLPEEMEACGPALRRVSEILDLPSYALHSEKEDRIGELCRELAKLPDELAIEAAEQVCRASQRYNISSLGPVVLHLACREGGVDAFDRLVEHWGRRDEGLMNVERVAQIVLDAPREVRLAICRRCVDRVLAAPKADRHELRQSPSYLAAAIASKAWPPGEDITPVLDALLAIPDDSDDEHDHDYALSKLDDALTLDGVDPAPVLDRVVEARLAGYPGTYRRIALSLDALLERAPKDVLRRTAEQALQSEDESTVTWAVKQLLGAAFDPEKDGPAPERAAAIVADRRLRAALFRWPALVPRALPALRAAMRRGELTYGQAVHTLEGVSTLYGGLAVASAMKRIHAAVLEHFDLEAERRKRCAEVEPFLGPPELSGPPTEEEWEALRRARAAETGDKERYARLWVRSLSEGPWRPDEREVFDELLALFRSGEVDGLDYSIGFAAAAKPEPELMPVLDEVVRKCGKNIRPLLREARLQARAALGIPPDAPAATAADGARPTGDLPGGEWEEDDDGEGG